MIECTGSCGLPHSSPVADQYELERNPPRDTCRQEIHAQRVRDPHGRGCVAILPRRLVPRTRLGAPPHRSCHLPWGKAECMHASIACLLFYEDYVWVSLGNEMKAKQSKAEDTPAKDLETRLKLKLNLLKCCGGFNLKLCRL